MPIRRVVRHLTQKPIYRVHTDTSFVDVTADHSLISKEGLAVPPLNTVGIALLETHPATNSQLKVDWPLFVQRCKNTHKNPIIDNCVDGTVSDHLETLYGIVEPD